MKNVLVGLIVLLSGLASAQVSLSAGSTTIKGFGSPLWHTGFHVGVEIPRDDAMSFYGKYTHQFSRAGDSIIGTAIAIDPTTQPYIINVMTAPTMNYNIFEGGTRYYLGDGFDFGWAGYGGTNFLIVYNKVKTKSAEFDQTLYEIDESVTREGGIFSIGAGLSAGVKYSMPRVGTFYTDFSVNYMLLSQATDPNIYSDQFSSLFFGINIGYRRDLFW